MTEQPMSKREARAWLRRSREGIAWANDTIRRGDLDDLKEAMIEITGAAAQVQQAVEEGMLNV